MYSRPTIWIATMCVALSALSAHSAHADNKNEIRTVTFDEDAGATRIHIRGARTPTFTVYKLERPTRVVLDLPLARLADTLSGHEGGASLMPNTWAVSTIAAQQLKDGGQLVRVIVTLARPGRYDVKAEGTEVVVSVSSREAAPRTEPSSGNELARANELAKANELPVVGKTSETVALA